MFSEANRFEYLTQGESRSDRGEAADSRREPAQIGAAVEDCPAYAAAVLACSLLFSLYAFPLPATRQLFQLFNPSFPPGHLLGAGRLPNLSPSVGCPFARFPPSSGSAALAVQLFRRLLVLRRRARPDTSQSARGRCCAQSAKILANWLGLKNTHSQGLVILSGHYFRPGSPAGRAAKRICSAATWARHFACCTLTHHPVGGQECSRLLAFALAACSIQRVQRHVPAFRLVCTKSDRF